MRPRPDSGCDAAPVLGVSPSFLPTPKVENDKNKIAGEIALGKAVIDARTPTTSPHMKRHPRPERRWVSVLDKAFVLFGTQGAKPVLEGLQQILISAHVQYTVFTVFQQIRRYLAHCSGSLSRLILWRPYRRGRGIPIAQKQLDSALSRGWKFSTRTPSPSALF